MEKSHFEIGDSIAPHELAQSDELQKILIDLEGRTGHMIYTIDVIKTSRKTIDHEAILAIQEGSVAAKG